MSYTLEQLSKDIRQALKNDAGEAGKEKVCKLLSVALRDKEFIGRHVTADQCSPRKVLYEDSEMGFCICGHVYAEPRSGSPHDHGFTWAIYGVAEGTTEMTDWKIVKTGNGDTPTLVEPVRTYEMKPGDSHYYSAHAVHSPKMSPHTKLVRVEGANLDHVKRSNIKAA